MNILSPAPRRLFRRHARTAFALLAAVVSSSTIPMSVAGQSSDEPVLGGLLGALDRDALRFGLLLQVVGDPAIDADDRDAASVQVAAMRVRMIGRLDGGFEYLFQTNFAATSSILDARVGWRASPAFGIQAGRFKTPFSRELLTYAGSIDFVNRSRVVDALAPGRQGGVQILGSASRVDWTVGAFTGASAAPVQSDLLGAARLGFRLTDPDDGGARVEVALSGAAGRDGAVGARAMGRSFKGDGSMVGADLRVESGNTLLAAEFIQADWDPAGAADVDASGLYVTAGWMVAPDHQLLARWDRYTGPGAEADDALVLGFNAWPSTATEVQINWLVPLAGSSAPHKLLVNFQVGF